VSRQSRLASQGPRALRARGETARGEAASCRGKAERGEAAFNLVYIILLTLFFYYSPSLANERVHIYY